MKRKSADVTVRYIEHFSFHFCNPKAQEAFSAAKVYLATVPIGRDKCMLLASLVKQAYATVPLRF